MSAQYPPETMALHRSSVGGLGWPTPPQRLLLGVLVLDCEPARAAWAEWRKDGVLDTADVGSRRLLPLVVGRFAELGIEDGELERLKGVARHTWASNHERVRSCLEAAAALTSAGVRVCALKGLGLLHSHYDADFAVRPMYDTDLLVPPDRAAEARAILESLGFKPGPSAARARGLARQVRWGMGHAFTRGYSNIDLHWHVLHQDPSSFFDAIAWDHARPLERANVPGLLELSPTELLLHVCLHGVRYDSTANRIWALDAVRILARSGNAVDWARLTRVARQRCLTVALGDALEFLVSLGANVPSHVIETLGREPVLPAEILEYRAITGVWSELSPRVRDASARMASLRRRFQVMTPQLIQAERGGTV